MTAIIKIELVYKDNSIYCKRSFNSKEITSVQAAGITEKLAALLEDQIILINKDSKKT